MDAYWTARTDPVAEERLAENFTSESLAGLIGVLRLEILNNHAYRDRPDPRRRVVVEGVELRDARATLNVCEVDDQVQYDAVTGDVLDATPSTSAWRIDMVETAAGWMVAGRNPLRSWVLDSEPSCMAWLHEHRDVPRTVLDDQRASSEIAVTTISTSEWANRSAASEPADFAKFLALVATVGAVMVAAGLVMRRRSRPRHKQGAPRPAFRHPRGSASGLPVVVSSEFAVVPEDGARPLPLLVRSRGDQHAVIWNRRPSAPPPPEVESDGDRCWTGNDANVTRYLQRIAVVAGEPWVRLGVVDDCATRLNLRAVEGLVVVGEDRAIRAWFATVAIDLRGGTQRATARRVQVPVLGQPQDGYTLELAPVPEDRPPVLSRYRLEITGVAARLHDLDSDLDITFVPTLTTPTSKRSTRGAGTCELDPQPEDAERVEVTNGAGERSHLPEPPTSLPTKPMPSPRPAPSGQEPANHRRGPALDVAVLGPVEVRGWATPLRSQRPKDVLVCLAMMNDGVDRFTVLDAVWQGRRVQQKALYNHITTIRRHTGRPDVIRNEAGRYWVDRELVSTDWHRFRELTRVAGDERVPQLVEALNLVRGRPFEASEQVHGWAFDRGLVAEIELSIGDAAVELAIEALAAADRDLAVWAAERGLQACPWLSRLYGLLIDAHSLAGSADLVEHAWQQAQRAFADDAVPTDVADAYNRALVMTAAAGQNQ